MQGDKTACWVNIPKGILHESAQTEIKKRENYKGAGISWGSDSYDLSVTDQWPPAAEVMAKIAKPMCSMHETKKTMTIEAVRGMGIKMDLWFLVRSREFYDDFGWNGYRFSMLQFAKRLFGG